MTTSNAIRSQAIALCTGMLDGSLDLVSGCHGLSALRFEPGGDEVIPVEFTGYSSELDGVPDPSRYALWEPTALKRQLAKLELYRAVIVEAARRLLAKLR